MKSVFRKYLVGLSVFALLVTASCSKREESSSNDTPGASSLNSAQATLDSIGLKISIPTMGDFADTTGTGSAALTSVFTTLGDVKSFDTTKFSSLESAISDLQSSLTSYTTSPKQKLLLSPSSISAADKNSDLAYIHFLLGVYYTVHSYYRLTRFIYEGIVVIQGNRYKLQMDGKTLADFDNKGRQAILDAYFMLNGVRYQVDNSTGTGKIYANKNLPAGSTRCASYHLDKAIFYAGDVFVQLKTALTKLQTDSFKAFFDELAAKMTAMGITELATD